MRFRFVCLALAALTSATAASWAQPVPVQVKVDTGTFLYDGAESLLEIYLSFGASSLPYQRAGDGPFTSSLPIKLSLLPVASSAPEGTEQQAVYEQDVEYRFQVSDTTSLMQGQVFVEQIRATVPPGDYELAVDLEVAGDDGPLTVRLIRDVEVPRYAAAPAVSSIQVATAITQATDPGDSFVKSGLVVRPNPDTFYGQALGSIPYYAEIYNPGDEGDNYTLLTFLTEANQPNPLPGKQSRSERAVRQVDVIVGQMDISDLPSGIYALNMAVLGPGNESVAETRKRVYVINPDIERPGGAPDLDYEETLFAIMSGEELDLNLQHASVVGTQSEQSRIRELRDSGTEEERRGFLASFWRSRDQQPNPLINDAYEQFRERLRVADQSFREPGVGEGFKSDRGQTYIKYGPPSNVQRNSFDKELIPHEVWQYESIPGEGSAIFVFADRYGSNSFELIHSTVRGEVSLADWERELRTLSGNAPPGFNN